MLETIRLLREEESIHFQITGAGSNYDRLRDACEADHLTHVSFEGYAPLDQLSEHLALADCSVVIFNAAFRDVLLPSKYYGILASGRAVLLISGCVSDIARDIEHDQIGATFDHGQAQELADTLRTWQANRDAVCQMGRRARALYEQRYHKTVILEAYRHALQQVSERGIGYVNH
ncbi:MAG: glycosyltransferase [Clostridia bacterium]